MTWRGGCREKGYDRITHHWVHSVSQHSRPSWEYKLVSRELITGLDPLGAEGWEVVSDNKDLDILILKRPGLTFQEQVTLDQRRRYFAEWGIDIDAAGGKSAT